MSPQTIPQILRCFILGRYTARVAGGGLKVRGPQPLAGPLPASIKARRDDLIPFLEEWCGGVWPPAEGSELRWIQQSAGCSLDRALDALEVLARRGAA